MGGQRRSEGEGETKILLMALSQSSLKPAFLRSHGAATANLNSASSGQQNASLSVQAALASATISVRLSLVPNGTRMDRGLAKDRGASHGFHRNAAKCNMRVLPGRWNKPEMEVKDNRTQELWSHAVGTGSGFSGGV